MGVCHGGQVGAHYAESSPAPADESSGGGLPQAALRSSSPRVLPNNGGGASASAPDVAVAAAGAHQIRPPPSALRVETAMEGGPDHEASSRRRRRSRESKEIIEELTQRLSAEQLVEAAAGAAFPPAVDRKGRRSRESTELPGSSPLAARALSPPLASLSLDRLAYVSRLGGGGFGTVVLMRHRDDGRAVALKVIKRERVKEAEDRRLLLSERSLLGELTPHPMLVSFWCGMKDQLNLYLAMEHVAGGDLQGYMAARGALSASDQRLVLASATFILAYLHSRGVVFRDLKKENLLVTSSGYLKLCDFGIAKAIGTGPDARTYTFCGSVNSMAPERFDPEGDGDGHGFACDWWSLGILAFECAFSQTPYSMLGAGGAGGEATDALTDVLEKLLDEEFMPDLLQQMAGYPGSSAVALALMRSLLAYEPEERPLNAVQVRGQPFFDGFAWDRLEQQSLPPEATLAASVSPEPAETRSNDTSPAQGDERQGSGSTDPGLLRALGQSEIMDHAAQAATSATPDIMKAAQAENGATEVGAWDEVW